MYFEWFFFHNVGTNNLGTNMPKCMQSALCGETEERETSVMSIFELLGYQNAENHE